MSEKPAISLPETVLRVAEQQDFEVVELGDAFVRLNNIDHFLKSAIQTEEGERTTFTEPNFSQPGPSPEAQEANRRPPASLFSFLPRSRMPLEGEPNMLFSLFQNVGQIAPFVETIIRPENKSVGAGISLGKVYKIHLIIHYALINQHSLHNSW
jgi:hypothetical protein